MKVITKQKPNVANIEIKDESTVTITRPPYIPINEQLKHVDYMLKYRFSDDDSDDDSQEEPKQKTDAVKA
jgi:hypothetical protein